jgi:hypothetical protein
MLTRDILATITIVTSKQRLAVSAIYCLSRYNVYANEYKTLFNKINSRFIIENDFTAKHNQWGSRLITTKFMRYTRML